MAAVGLALTGCSSARADTGRSAGTSATTATSTPSSTATTSPVPHPVLPAKVLVVGIGDSVTSASHCACAGFVSDYGQLLRERYHVDVTAVEYGVGGATTETMLPLLSGDGTVAQALRRADIVSVTIGANDLNAARASYTAGTCEGSDHLACFTPAIARMQASLETDLQALAVLTAGRRVQVLVNDYWNVFEDGQVARAKFGAAFVRDSDTVTREADSAICIAAAKADAVCVDTYQPFKGFDGGKDPTGLLASDGNHPNPAGHEVIAKAMLACGLPAFDQ